jgi:DNA-binding CsgD family transcriptional regulator
VKTSVIDLLSRLDARPPGSAYDVTRRFFESLGFTIVNAAVISKSDQSYLGICSNMSEAWLKHYVAEGYHTCDVALDYLIANDQPGMFCQETFRSLPSSNHALSEKLIDDIHDEGMHSSFILQRHSVVSDRVIGFNLGSAMERQALEALVNAQQDEILLAAALAQTAILEDFDNCPLGPDWLPVSRDKLQLSPREAEVLRWLSEGFRNDRIAEKMGVTVATVRFHVTSAKRKLGARTREQAVAVAITKKLIK